MSTTAELAVAVHKHLIKLKAGARFPRSSPKSAIPDASVLRNVFDVVYHASLKTEEGKSVIARLCVVDPNNPEDYPPPRPRPDRWAIVPLASRFPLNVATLVKIAQAADPWSSSLAVYYDAGGSFFIWGLIDQAVRWNRMLVREGLGYDLPGLINVVANGIADISVYRELGFLARLQQDTLIEQQNDVFWDGPVAERLQTWIEPSLESVRQKVTPELWDSDVETPSRSYDLWIGFLCRILLSIQRYRHGGALLLTDLNEELFPRYKISYDRASRHLEELAAIKIRERKNWTDLRRIIRERPNDAIPYSAYRNEFILNLADDDLEESLTGAVRFIASLSRIDGLVLMRSNLKVNGFGVEIRTDEEVEKVCVSSAPNLAPASSTIIEANHFGTRHRSMMRYCYGHPDSLGFVVSQDGDIRASMRVGEEIVLWDNLKVHLLWRDDLGEAVEVSKADEMGSSEAEKIQNEATQ